MIDISYLKNEVREMIQLDVVDVAKHHSKVGGGFYAIPRQVFCIVDFLGGVAYNNRKSEPRLTSTRKAVRFIKDFFPVHYRSFPDLIVAMWRHGTVHGFRPLVYYTYSGNKRITVKWSSNNGDEDWNRAVNIRLLDTNTEGTVLMAVNISQLAADLLAAFDKLTARIEKDQAFGRACVRRMNRLLSPVNCKTARTHKRKRDRGKLSTYKKKDVMRDQILKTASLTKGILRESKVTWY